MAHYAFLDDNNIVTQVIVGRDENEVIDGITDWESHYAEVFGQTCKRTSYNTYSNLHMHGGTPFRGNYASVGFSYDPEKDVFIPNKPYKAWVFNEEMLIWEAPIEAPKDEFIYKWDNDTDSWIVDEVACMLK